MLLKFFSFDRFFFAPEIEFSTIQDIEKNTPNIIIWAAPVMFLFVLIEWYIAKRQNHHLYEKKDSIGSICVGVGNVIINTLLKVSMFYIVILIYNFIPWRMHFNWWTLIPCYLIFDLASYWSHRISHEQRFWWATHVVHHSSENYNLTVSFRLSWMQNLKLIFFVPVMALSFHPIIFFITSQIAVLFQFWVHTEYIRRLPRFIEYVFATPSNHRVHHGSQEKYINKNYGATFIFWDRLFGTYQKEEEQALYGLTTPIENKANPIHLNFHEYADMWKDIKSAKGFKQKLFFLFGDPIDIAMLKKKVAGQEAAVDAEVEVKLPIVAAVPVHS